MNENTIVKDEWLDEIMAASDLKVDRRFKYWAKYVEDCDTSRDDGYSFEGEWIRPGTVRVPTGKHRLILACATSGSRKYHYRHFQLLIMRPDTTLVTTEILTDDRRDGWALRMQETVCALLEDLESRDQLILSPSDGILSAAMGFDAALSRLPEEDHLQWYHWLFEEKETDLLEQVIEMLQEMRQMPRIQDDDRDRDRETEILGSERGGLD